MGADVFLAVRVRRRPRLLSYKLQVSGFSRRGRLRTRTIIRRNACVHRYMFSYKDSSLLFATCQIIYIIVAYDKYVSVAHHFLDRYD